MNSNLDLRTREEREAYALDKHYLGPLCKREHDAGNGQSWRHNGHGNCVECTRLGAREWAKANPQRHNENTRRRDARRIKMPQREARRKWPFAVHMGGKRRQALGAGLPYDLSVDWAKLQWRAQDGRCFWTGREMDFLIGADRHPMRPSLDRITPGLGYVQGNVVWATNFANRARGELSAGAFSELMVSMGFPQADLSGFG